MLIDGNDKVYQISAKISEDKISDICYYIKGAVYSYCNNNKSDVGSQEFSAYNLFGEDNYYWNDPLIELYNYHISMGNSPDKAKEQAGRDIGWLLKRVLSEDTERSYKQSNAQRKFVVNAYQWIK